MNSSVVPYVVQRVRAEYLEMPGLALRCEQIQRLCGVDTAVCESVLKALVESGFLSQRADGAYARDRSSDIPRARPAKAGLEPRAESTVSRSRPLAS